MDDDEKPKRKNSCSLEEKPAKRKKVHLKSILSTTNRYFPFSKHHQRSIFFDLMKERWQGIELHRPWNVHTKSFYSNLACVNKYDPMTGDSSHGAVFNLEFSPEGRYVVGACEKLDVVIFDPISHKKVSVVPRAHNDCVNCVTFLDSRTFATCSDDSTVSLWDIRHLSSRVRTLVGHASWVKSLSYNATTQQLVTSAFDDTIRTWDINKYSESGVVRSRKILRIRYLTRMKLSPDFTKMIVATTTGLIVVVHDLDMDKLKTDWKFVEPDDIRSEQAKLHPKRNRVEYLTEFPADSNPWCVSSLQVHPYGWNVLSRYSSHGASTEWTTVHDLQDFHKKDCDSSCRGKHSRLVGYVQEPNIARGYIKEHCFNGDGRIICSPFGNGIRLLGFNKDCDEVSACHPQAAVELYEVGCCISHKNAVLTARFSPCLPLLATGCLGGQVSFYQPRF